MSDSQTLIDIVRRLVRQEVRNNAKVLVRDGYISDASSYNVSAYLDGDEEQLVENIEGLAGFYSGAGQYVTVHTNESGTSWISRIRSQSLFPKMEIDVDNGRLLLGDGASPPNIVMFGNGTFTPTLTFATPGNLSVSYSSNTGSFTRMYDCVFFSIELVTSSFTHTSASGELRVAGLPMPSDIDTPASGGLESGWTKASYTHTFPVVKGGQSYLYFDVAGSGQANAALQAADVPTGGTVRIRASGFYFV